jgi:hypothetical protein
MRTQQHVEVNPGPDMTAPRIRWDADEQRKVAVEAFRIIESNNTIHKMQAIELAQKKVLRPARRRRLEQTNFSQFRWMEPIWQSLTEARKAGAKKAANDLFESPATPTVTPEPEAKAEPEYPILERVEQELEKQNAQPEQPPPESPPQSVTVVPDATATPQPAAQTRKQVHWTEDEKRQLAARAHYLLRTFEDMKPIEALRKAVESELPADRYREVHTLTAFEWFVPMVEQVKAEEAAEAQRLKEQQEIEARIAQEAAERIEREARAREEEIERRVNQRVNALSFDDLIRNFARKLAGDMLVAMRDELRAGIMGEVLDAVTAPTPTPAPAAGPELPHEPPHASAPEKKLPKVMVVGLPPNQESEVEKAFRGTLEFDFVKSTKQGGVGEGGHAMLRRSATCDVVVAMSEAGLDVEQKRKQLTVPFRRVTGAASSLKRWLTLLANGSVDLSSSNGLI